MTHHSSLITAMDNSQVAHVFSDIAELLELKGENPFKIRAYRRAAEAIQRLPLPLEQTAREGKLREIPGIGEAIEGKIEELLRTGRLGYHERLQAEFPPGVRELTTIPGIGPRTAARLCQELGITSVEQLEEAARDGRIAGLPGLGQKTAENILRAIERERQKDRRLPIGLVQPVVAAVLAGLADVPGLRNLTPAGSVRRFRETVGDVDLIGTADDQEAAMAAFVALPFVREVLARGPTKTSVIVDAGLQVDLRLLPHESFGSLLQHFTGSKQHNIDLRELALRKGLSVSEYGITVLATGVVERFAREEQVYARLGLQWIPPEIREATDELELAARHALPTLIELDDLRGDLHAHTVWSDGRNTVEEMARAAAGRGYEYLAICDHSPGLGIAGGLDPDRLRRQIDEIRAVEARLGGAIRLFAGSEVNIRPDGSLDLPDELLANLDVVVASIHSSMGQDAEKMTRRLLRAIRHPHVDIIGHPTARLIGVREPVQLDIAQVFAAARECGTILEINGGPERLDLRDVYVREAKSLSIPLAIGSDAHSVDQLDFAWYGVKVARRGWCQAADAVNTWSRPDIEAFLRTPKPRRLNSR